MPGTFQAFQIQSHPVLSEQKISEFVFTWAEYAILESVGIQGGRLSSI
jgi:hypothetical protein